MAYFLGKDVDVYWTTEQYYAAVSGTYAAASTGTALSAVMDANMNADIGACFVRSRENGISTNTQLSDITGVDFTPGAMNEDISFMGKNTNLSAQVKHEFSLTLTKKKNDLAWDRLYNDHGRDGVYTTSGGAVVADYMPVATGSLQSTGVVHDGLTTSRIQNFGYRVYLVLKDGSEVFVIKNCCITGHTISLNADGTQEESLELYSYVKPALTNTKEADEAHSITGLTAMTDI